MSITKEQRDEIKRRAVLLVPDGPCAYRLANLTDYLDSLVAEPEEQPTMWTQTTTFVDDEARLHAEDARAAMAEVAWREGNLAEAAKAAHDIADAMAAERKRRMG